MLIDARPRPSTVSPTVALPTSVTVDTLAVTHSPLRVRELVQEAGLLVAELGLRDGARWAEASAAVATTAATLRSALIDFTDATRPLHATGPVDDVPVAASAAPVVRAREIGFLASRLTAVLDDVSQQDQIRATMTAIGDRLQEDLRGLRRAVRTDTASTALRRHTGRSWRRR